MSWKIIFLIIAIACIVMAIWKLSRHGNLFTAMVGILWFFTVLFLFFVPGVYDFVIIKGVPSLGRLIHYVALPIFIILSMSSIRHRY